MGDLLATTTIRFATTEGSAAPAAITTNSSQMSDAVISGPGAAFIGSVGLAGVSSLFPENGPGGRKVVVDMCWQLDYRL